MRNRTGSPAVDELFVSPELGVLAVLEAAIDVTRIALIAAYPDDISDADNIPIERRAAYGLVDAAHGVESAIHRYRLALARARERDRDRDDPF